MTQTKRRSLLRIELRAADLNALGRAATMAGFDGLELSADDVPRRDVTTADSHKTVGAVFATRRAGSLEDVVGELSDRLHDSAAVGAQCMNLTILPPMARSEAVSHQDTLNFVYNLVRAVRFEAESSGVVVALEGGAPGFLLSPLATREIIDAANSWAIGVCLDVDRIALFGDPADWIASLHRRIHCIRMRAEPTSDDGAAPKRNANLKPAVIADALDRIRYDRIVIASGMCEPEEIRERLDAVIGPRRDRIRAAASQ